MRRMTPIAALLTLGITLAATGAAISQTNASGMSPERLERVTAALDKHIAAGTIAGAVSLIYRHGEVAHISARGFQDMDAQTPMQRDTIFGLASMTKPITAVSVMMLVEEGKLSLDAAVDQWLPELANPKVLNDPNGPLDEVHDSPRPITLRDLLRYTMGIGTTGYAGIAAEAPIAEAFAALRGGGEITADAYMKRLGALPLVDAPGERFMYSTPSRVTGVLISRVSGMGLDRFMETRIFDLLGMDDTGFWVPADKRDRLATYYRADEQSGTLVPVPNSDERYKAPPVFPSGSGGLASTVDDYLQFARMMLNKGEVDGVRLLSRASIELMTTDHMPEDPDKRFFINENFWRGAGFGFGVEVVTERLNLNGPSVGSYWWQGATGVAWTADPQEDMIWLRLIQGSRGAAGFSRDYLDAVYQAIAD